MRRLLCWALLLLALCSQHAAMECHIKDRLVHFVGNVSFGAQHADECSELCEPRAHGMGTPGSCVNGGYGSFLRVEEVALDCQSVQAVIYATDACQAPGFYKVHTNASAYGAGDGECVEFCTSSPSVGTNGSCGAAGLRSYLRSEHVDAPDVDTVVYETSRAAHTLMYGVGKFGINYDECLEVWIDNNFLSFVVGLVPGTCADGNFPEFSHSSSAAMGPIVLPCDVFHAPTPPLFHSNCTNFTVGAIFPVEYGFSFTFDSARLSRETYYAMMAGAESVNQDPDLPNLSLDIFDETNFVDAVPYPLMRFALNRGRDECNIGILGSLFSAPAALISPVCSMDDTLYMSVLPEGADLIDKSFGNGLHFMMRSSPYYRAIPALIKAHGWSRISVIYDGYYEADYDAMALELQAKNIRVDSLSPIRGFITLGGRTLDAQLGVSSTQDAVDAVKRAGSKIIVALCLGPFSEDADPNCGEALYAAALAGGLIGDGYVWLSPRHGEGPVAEQFEAFPNWKGLVAFGRGAPSAEDIPVFLDDYLVARDVKPEVYDIAHVQFYLSVRILAMAAQANLNAYFDPTSGVMAAKRLREGVGVHQFDDNQDYGVGVDIYTRRGSSSVSIGVYSPILDSVEIDFDEMNWGFSPGFVIDDGSLVALEMTSVSLDVVVGKVDAVNEFMILSRNSFGEMTTPTQEFSVAIDGPALKSLEVAPPLNGTTKVAYTVASGGVYIIGITLNGQHVPGSPFETTVPSTGLPLWAVICIIVGGLLVLGVCSAILFYMAFASKQTILDPQFEVHPDDLIMYERLGVGSFGEVFHADWRGSEVAVKKCRAALSVDMYNEFIHEVEIMCQLRHPNVLLFMGASTDRNNLIIVTEFMQMGDVYALINDPNVSIPFGRQLQWLTHCIKGMSFLHSAQPPILHKDLKTLNLLVTQSWDVKVADFGMAGVKDTEHTNDVGSLMWMAPEVLEHSNATQASDVYSFGIIMWEVLTRLPLYEGKNLYAVTVSVINGKRPDFPDVSPHGLTKIAARCWHQDPEERPKFVDLLPELKQYASADSFNTCTSSEDKFSLLEAPSGTVTLVFTDVQDSTCIWEQFPQAMSEALQLHNQCHRKGISKYGGYEVKTEGDAFMVAFQDPDSAVRYSVYVQQSLLNLLWPNALLDNVPSCQEVMHDGQHVWRGLRVRIGMHTGQPERHQDPITQRMDYFGRVVNLSARVGGCPVGGQIVISQSTFEEVNWDDLAATAEPLGTVRLKGIERSVSVYQVTPDLLHSRTFPTLKNLQAPGSAPPGSVELVNVSISDDSESEHESKFIIDYDDIVFGAALGTGSFGETFEATLHGEKRCAKRLLRKKLPEEMYFDFRAEVTIMCMLDHPNIIEFVGFTAPPHLVLVSEFAEKGALSSCLQDVTFQVDGPFQASMYRGITSAMMYLHSLQPIIVHRDLKCANVLVMKDLTPRIADFGLARLKTSTQTMTTCGTVAWTAPETLSGTPADERVDVYSFGVVMWELFTRKTPHQGLGQMRTVRLILKENLRPPVPANTPAPYKTMMEKCWQQKPDDRPSFAELYDYSDTIEAALVN